MAIDRADSGLSAHLVASLDAELPLLSELLCVRPREREGTRRGKGVYVEYLEVDAMQSMEWRRVRPRA